MRFSFLHSFLETDGGGDGWGAVAVADFDGDGGPEFVTGSSGGFSFLYDFDPNESVWHRHTLSRAFSPNVGAADFDGDGCPDLLGKVWRGAPGNGSRDGNHGDVLRNSIPAAKKV